MQRVARGATLVLTLIGCLVVGRNAQAKIIPLEVQIADGDRTVRISPNDVFDTINDGTATGSFGIFDYARRPMDLDGRPIALTLSVYESTDGSNTMHDTLGPGVERRTWIVFDYYPHAGGAFGVIAPGGMESAGYTPGEWVRFTPTFTEMVDNARETSPAVTPVRAPPHRSVESAADPVVHPLVIPAMGVVIAVGIVVLLSLRATRKARERDRASRERLTDAEKDDALAT